MKRTAFLLVVWALLISFSFSACAFVNQAEPASRPETETASESESLPAFESENLPASESEPEAADNRTFLEKEKENDPIFTAEDPFAGMDPVEIDALMGTMPEEEFHTKFSTHMNRLIADDNYPLYYYYYSGRSEYKAGYNTKKPTGYDLLSMVASYSVPESFILNMLADACVVMHMKETATVTVERTYENDEVRKKMEAMGESPTHDVTYMIFEVEECLWGDMEGNKEIFILPRMVSLEFVDILSDPSKTFVAFLWREAALDDNAYNQTGLPEYGLLVRGTFDYTDGRLSAYCNLEDVCAYDGMTAEEMIEKGIEQAEKYKEVLDYVRGRR